MIRMRRKSLRMKKIQDAPMVKKKSPLKAKITQTRVMMRVARLTLKVSYQKTECHGMSTKSKLQKKIASLMPL